MVWKREPTLVALGLLLTAGILHSSWPQDNLTKTKIQSSRGRPQQTVEFHLAQGYAALKNNRYSQAEHEFKAALALNPHLVLRARFPLAIALFEAHQPVEARREFETVRHTVGDEPNVMYYLGRMDLMEGKIDAAIHALTVAESRPPFPDTAYYLGYAYLEKGEFALAEKCLLKAAQLVPGDPIVRYRLGVLYQKEGRTQKAKEAFALSGKLRNKQVEQDRLRLECTNKLNTSTLAEARPVCERLDDPTDAASLAILGTIYGQHGDYQDALKPLQRAADLMPYSPQMEYNLALCYFHLKQFAKARKPLAEAARRWPDLYNVSALYGLVLLRLVENKAAYTALKHAYDLNPLNPDTARLLFQLSLALAEQDRESEQYASELKYLREAARIFPNDPKPHRFMANAYLRTGRQDLAAREQRIALRLSSKGGPR